MRPKRRPPAASCSPRAPRRSRRKGIIVATGDGKTLDNGDKSTFCVSKGDRVLFTSYAGTDVKYDGAEYIIMREDDILAIIG